MKQQNSRMVVEVNKLIANALLSDGSIYLPNIGSLIITTTTNEGEDPIRDIVIKDDAQHKSLVVVISERGNCTEQQAEQVYKRWLEVVGKDDKITIFGIGDIADGKFTTTPQMFNKLNPVQAFKSQQSATPNVEPAPVKAPVEAKASDDQVKIVKAKARKVSEKRKGDSKRRYLWGLVAAIVLIVGVTYLFVAYDDKPQVIEAPVVVDYVIDNEPETIISEAEPVAVEVVEPVKPTAKFSGNSDAYEVLKETLDRSKESKARYKVVFGVFSSPSNSGRAIIKMVGEASDKDIDVRAYPYGGDTYMLTVFESNSASECEAFRKSDFGRSISEDLWIYEKK